MKPAQIFHQYIWIINTLRAYKRMTFEQLSQKWQQDAVADGNALQRSSFNRHRDAILSMFGIIIDCEPKTYCYYISNPETLGDDSIERWLFSTLTVHGVLSDSAAVKERVVLENVPVGLEYLETIIQAIKNNRRIRLGYRKFDMEGYVKTVCPYALKLFHQRWYLLAKKDDDEMRIYALDRMLSVSLTAEDFEMPSDFSPQQYFAEYFGVLTDGTPLAHVVLRAYGKTPNYLRTLPLHHSQRELQHYTDEEERTSNSKLKTDSQLSTLNSHPDDYTDFSFDLRPTADFLGQLLSYGDGIEVLEPADLRQKMKQLITQSLKRY